MTDAAAAMENKPKGLKKPLLLGVLLALLLGGAGFYATFSGRFARMIPAGAGPKVATKSAPATAFVPVPPLVISLPPSAHASHLQFAAQLEVDPAHRAEVAHLMPRVLDVMNTYLRAVQPTDLEQPSALIRLRAQLLRRIRIVCGEGRVRDLLVSQFALN